MLTATRGEKINKTVSSCEEKREVWVGGRDRETEDRRERGREGVVVVVVVVVVDQSAFRSFDSFTSEVRSGRGKDGGGSLKIAMNGRR